MKPRLLLFLWLAGMITPLNWLQKEFAVLLRPLNFLIAPEWVHILAHLILFSGLAVLIVRTFKLSLNLRTAVVLLTAILLTAGMQEVFQLQAKERGFGWPEVFDIGVDLMGGVVGSSLLLFQKLGRK